MLLPSNAYDENFTGSGYRPDEEEFLRAMALYQKRQGRRYPTWCEVLYVLHCLGYRKVAPAVDPQGKSRRRRRKEEPSGTSAETLAGSEAALEELIGRLRQRWLDEAGRLSR
ncbi:MAG: hypothetical protein NZU63_10890 [Gemmataceae bacterium]|nr:hypothetical protein [Gemmataceae bacterium]MDW8244434.1 hypothetical protein [Thermogemmata sp.]